MKILQVITTLQTGGAERLIVDMVPMYQKAGHQVDVLLFDGSESPFKKELESKGVNVSSLGIKKPIYSLSFIFRLIPIIREYDIVHTHNTACQFFVVLASLFLRKRPKLVTTEHNTYNRRRAIPGFKLIDKFIFRKFDTIIPISTQACENLKEQVGNLPSIHTIFNGVNLAKFTEAQPLDRNELKVSPDDYIMAMVAGFREQKDHETLIRSLKYLPSNFKLWLIGDGERKKEMELLVGQENLSDRVVFWGIRTDVARILKTADVVVMSSHWEGLSLSSIEGMCVGKPFVASDVDGLHEIVDGYGVLVPHQDAKALADAVLNLQGNQNYSRQVAEQCSARASNYDISKTIKQYLNVYRQLA